MNDDKEVEKTVPFAFIHRTEAESMLMDAIHKDSYLDRHLWNGLLDELFSSCNIEFLPFRVRIHYINSVLFQ